METSNSKDLVWVGMSPDIRCSAVSYGLTTIERINEAVQAYWEFSHLLADEWPESRIRQLLEDNKNRLLQLKREEYRKTAIRLKELELENRDARAKGMSYKDRKVYTQKIKAGHQLVQLIKQEVTLINKFSFPKFKAPDLVDPSDMPFVKRIGFEAFIGWKYPDSAYWSYPQEIPIDTLTSESVYSKS